MGRQSFAPAGRLGGAGPQNLEALWLGGARPAGQPGAGGRPPPRPHLADRRRIGPAGLDPHRRPGRLFDPLDEQNERWDELQGHADWHFLSPPFPPFLDIVNGLANLVARHPQTTFIGAHVGCYAEDLAWVSAVLDRCPNFYVDIAARIAELGRQPYTARRFFLQYADRILFGTDCGPSPEMYRIYYRFLETDDEYFNPNPGELPWQGRWFIYGLHLPDEVLQKVYQGNAARILRLKLKN